MNRNISICFIVLSFIVIILLTLSIRSEENKFAETTTEYNETETVIQVDNENEYYKYIIKCVDSRLEVYMNDNTLFMETGILYDELPEEIKQKIETGLPIMDDEQLYDFLESYSS